MFKHAHVGIGQVVYVFIIEETNSRCLSQLRVVNGRPEFVVCVDVITN